MTIQTLANILIGVALVGWIVYRQLTWRIVYISRMWRLPLIMGGVGIVMLAQTKDAHRISATDLAGPRPPATCASHSSSSSTRTGAWVARSTLWSMVSLGSGRPGAYGPMKRSRCAVRCRKR